tara:strand:+ start:147 stop:416 length:270 start_codon:yes stop_codon:yes gene_type:complete
VVALVQDLVILLELVVLVVVVIILVVLEDLLHQDKVMPVVMGIHQEVQHTELEVVVVPVVQVLMDLHLRVVLGVLVFNFHQHSAIHYQE